MKRDWHLMGDIFNAIEDDRLELLISKYESNQNKYSILMQHLEMLIDADYIKGVTISLLLMVCIHGVQTYQELL